LLTTLHAIGQENTQRQILEQAENYEEAISIVKDNNYNIKIVKVSTFDEAVDYLTS
jgi:PDZ domain-containing secreted protein